MPALHLRQVCCGCRDGRVTTLHKPKLAPLHPPTQGPLLSSCGIVASLFPGLWPLDSPPPHFYGPVPQLNACPCLGSVLSGALGNLRGKQRAHLHHCQSTPPPPPGPALSKVEPAMRQLPQPLKPTVDKPGPQHKAHTHTREMQVIGAVKRLLPKQKQ